jgi:hypothetical protein
MGDRIMNTISTIINFSSITCLNQLTSKQLNALKNIGISRLSDLLNYRPIINAKMLMALVTGQIIFDLDKSDLLTSRFAAHDVREISKLPLSALKGMSNNDEKVFSDEFRIRSIEELAKFKPFTEAERIVYKFANEFSEPSSAPDELMPVILGNVESSANFSSFIKDRTIKFNGLELVYDDQRKYVDQRLAALFPVQGLSALLSRYHKPNQYFKTPVPEIRLGYITKMSQKWINVGTHLGEIIHSLPLAPGESRNIAVIDWKRKQATRRKEDTEVSEELTNELFHKRALDEVTRSTATEHQFGSTDTAAGTAATAGAGVVGAALAGGVAGALPGAAIGAIAGGVAGAIAIPGVGEIPGIPAGALAGAVIGFGIGATIGGGAALLGAANAQLGTIHSETTGDRTIVGQLSQNITEMTVQKGSALRSLWSTVVVTDEQAENERLSTRNVTNYNHSHTLTIQYYEVLQHYKSELSLTAAEPILFLPFRPLEFTIDFIADYWHILSQGIRDVRLRKEYDAVINGIELEQELGSPKIEYIIVQIVRLGGLGIFAGMGSNNLTVNLAGIDGNSRPINNSTSFNFSEPVDADLLQGVQLLDVFPSETVKIFVRVGLVNNQNVRNIVSRESDFLSANSNGIINFHFPSIGGDGLTESQEQRKAEEIERYFNSRRYFFTRQLLLSIEKEQLIDLVESLMLRTAVEINLGGITATVPSLTGFSSMKRNVPETLIESTQNLLHQEIDRVITDNNVRLSPQEKSALLSGLIGEVNSSVGKANPSDPKDANQKRNTLNAVRTKVNKKFTSLPSVTTKAKNEIHEKIKDILSAGFAELAKVNFKDQIHLSEFIDPTPLAITGNTIIFKMKKVVDPQVLANNLVVNNNQVKALKQYPEEIADFIKKATTDLIEKTKYTRNADIYLPTSGVFAEAILGRSNASEKIDITRFFNWQDSPIPHLAPAINALTAASRQSEPISTQPTQPSNVLNIVNPTALPDPTGLTAVLGAIQNGNIFRDMSKAEQLANILSNLSSLAQNMANQAGTLAGTAQTEALRSAADIGKAVAQLAGQTASQPSNLPVSSTSQGAATNTLEKLLSSESGNIPANLDAFKKILGLGSEKIPDANELFKNRNDISGLLNDFAKSGVGDLKFNSGGESVELKRANGEVKQAGLFQLGTDELPSNIDFWSDLILHQVPMNIKGALNNRGIVVQDFLFAEEDVELFSSALNLDNFEVQIERMPVDSSGNALNIDDLLKEIRLKFDAVLNNTNLVDENPFAGAFLQLEAEDAVYDGITGIGFFLSQLFKQFAQADFSAHDDAIDKPVWESNTPLGAVMRFDTFADDMGVVVGKFANDNWIFSTVKDSRLPLFGSVGNHPVSGNRQFGYYTNSDNKFVVFTKGADRSTGKVESALMALTFFSGEIMWLSYQVGIKKLVESKGGEAKILRPFSKRFEFKKVIENLQGISI